MYDALVDGYIHWDDPDPWLALVRRLNDSQRALVAVAQAHEHAQVNGLQESLAFHGREFFSIAADGAARMGLPHIQEMFTAALNQPGDWDPLQDRWDREADLGDIAAFVDVHASDFFIDEGSADLL